MLEGIILKGIGGFYYVDTEKGIFECKARGNFRHKSKSPMVGDRVTIEETEPMYGYILEIHERKNSLIRPSICNIDKLVIVVSEAPPKTDTLLIDKVSAICENQEIEVLIFINKIDINSGETLKEIYEKAGFKVILGSAYQNIGVKELEEEIKGKVVAFTGNSAVGKSSILNILDEEFNLKTGGLSEKIGRGKHTTRHVELLKTRGNSFVADTPGFSTFDVAEVDVELKANLPHCFIEFRKYLGHCKFTNCNHTKEKGCAILEALENSEISKSRHENYVKLYESLKDIKDWEIRKNV